MAEAPILIDVSATGDAGYATAFLEGLDHPTMVCNGPGEGNLCPILEGFRCDMVDSARGIVFELDLDEPQHRAILKQYVKTVAEDVPIRVVIRPGQEVTYADALVGVRWWTHQPTVGELDGFAAEVEAASAAAEAERNV